jgi:DNA-binding CsgD family transcriptional regulator
MEEAELLVNQQEQLYGIQKLLKNNQLNLDDITELIPGVVHLNEIHTLDLTYLDKKSREVLEVSKEELILNGKKVLNGIVKPESFDYAKKYIGKMDFENLSLIASHFQALRFLGGNDDFEWFFSVKKKFDDKRIITISTPIKTLGAMQDQVKKVLEENFYIRKNLPRLNSLTMREKEIIKLIFYGYSSNQIAEKLFISPHTVGTHRKNIKTKLKIRNYNELSRFAMEFELI